MILKTLSLLKGDPMPSTLKQQLILSIKALDLYKKTKVLRNVAERLENSTHEGDEKEVADLIWHLVDAYPEVIYDPNNQQLEKFCLSVKAPLESKQKSSYKK
jgi:hypothetical protein